MANGIDIKVFNMNVTLYAPEIFLYFLKKDEIMINLESSLCLLANKQRIQAFGGPDGGKSGEFFFFSWDNKIILKTM